MIDKKGREIKIGLFIKIIDLIGIFKIIDVHPETDQITVLLDDGKRFKTSPGICEKGFGYVWESRNG